MSKIKVDFVCGLYDRVLPLYLREVEPEGVDLNFVVNDTPREIFDRMSGRLAFDACEMSCSELVTQHAAGNRQFVAVPVFPSRLFRHRFIVVNRRAGIRTPKDLEGKRVGVPIYTATAAVYIRGLLQHEYGVDLSSVSWIEGDMTRPGKHGNPLETPLLKAVAIERNTSDRSLTALLEENAIDATLGSSVPPTLNRHPDLVRLFPDYKRVETEYFRRTGIFPIMHAVVIRRDLHERHPFLAASLYRAFCRSKEIALERIVMNGSAPNMLPWAAADAEELTAACGGDFWPYGVDANRRTLTAFVNYLAEQAMIPAPAPIEELFVPV